MTALRRLRHAIVLVELILAMKLGALADLWVAAATRRSGKFSEGFPAKQKGTGG